MIKIIEQLELELKNAIEEKRSVDAFLEWLDNFKESFKDEDFYEVFSWEYDYECPSYEFPTSDKDALADIWSYFDEYVWSEGYETVDELEDLPCILDYIEFYKKNRGLPKEQWEYPYFMKYDYITCIGYSGMEVLSEEEVQRYKDYLNELADDDNVQALHVRLYNYYEGNRVFAQDFKAARDDAERLFEITMSAQYANTLGYIYYYGRCTDGVPEYEKAYKYFSYGAANGIYESIYKLADMYKNGYAVWKSEETAFKMIHMLYDDIRPKHLDGDYNNKFADVALRLGSMYLHGTGVYKNVEWAVEHLLEAESAIKYREQYDYYGDKVVAASIQKTLAEAKEEMPPVKNTGKYKVSASNILDQLLHDHKAVHWKAKQMKDGRWSIKFYRKLETLYGDVKNTFVTIPEIYYCDFTSSVRMYANVSGGEMPTEGCFDEIKHIWNKGAEFVVLSRYGEPVLEIIGDEVLLKTNNA